jgi:hypothetical protein
MMPCSLLCSLARRGSALVAQLITVIAVLSMSLPAYAERRPLPESEWNDETRLTLAQVMVGEADWHEPDHIAIAFVLARRWVQYQQGKGPISFQRYIQLYSSTMKVGTTRAKWVRALPWGEFRGPHAKRWGQVQQLVTAWGAGKVKDPCPRAEHWGGAMDRPGRGWEPTSCGLTKNIFYAHRDKRIASR